MDIKTTCCRITKDTFIGALKGIGEKAHAIVGATADLVKANIEGVGNCTAAIEKREGEIVSRAEEAANEMGGDLMC